MALRYLFAPFEGRFVFAIVPEPSVVVDSYFVPAFAGFILIPQ